MKVKIKVKTLLILMIVFILAFFWGVPAAILGIADYLENKGSDRASLFYEKYASYPVASNIRGKFLYADSLVKSFDKYKIFFSSWGGGEDTSPEDMEKAKKILEDIMKEDPGGEEEKEYYMDSYELLLDMAIATGDAEMLHKWISFGQAGRDEKLIYTAELYSGFFLHVNGDKEGAEKIIAKYETTDLADGKLELLKAETALFDGDYEKAGEIYEKLDNRRGAKEKGVFGSTGYYDRRYWYQSVWKSFKGDHVIRGTVSYEGEPMPFVEIYAYAAADGGFRSSGESYIGITDENGEFETLGLRDGVYNVGIGVEGSLLTDKVLQSPARRYLELDGTDAEIDFVFNKALGVNMPAHGEKISGNEFTVSWEKVEGAEYYTVEPVIFFEPYEKSGGSYRSAIADQSGEDKFTGTSAKFNIEMLKNRIGGLSYSGEEMLLWPNTVLGAFLPGIEYPIVVDAYDGDHNLITSSLPLRDYYDGIPSITAEGSLTEGENLILRKKYPEAIEYYENILKDNPDDPDALRYLAKIYGTGWKEGEKDPERAIALGRRYADVSGNGELLFWILSGMGTDEIKENRELVRAILEEKKEDLDDEGYGLLSRYYIAVENWEEAREALRNIEGYVPDDLFYLNMYFGDYAGAAENIQSEKFYISRLSAGKVINALKALESRRPKDPDRQAFNNFLLKLVTGVNNSMGRALYDETVSRITDNHLKAILHEIFLERNWDVGRGSEAG